MSHTKGLNMAESQTIAKVADRMVATLKALVRTRVTTGLITVLPIIVTLWVLRFVFRLMRDASLWLVEYILLSSWGSNILESWGIGPADLTQKGFAAYPAFFQWTISIFSVLVTISLLYILGFITANIVGRRAINLTEQIVDRVPLVKTIYRSCKQIVGAFGSAQQSSFQSVALVPFPNDKMRAVAFVTSKFTDSTTGTELATVFIPSTPNPTTGFLQVLKQDDLTEVDWTVEQAITTIMSVGMIRSESISIAGKDKP
jgi:uncharacterized membrane protein